MARNICIFSDGTGQAGGDNPINWTNVYRLYKSTRDIDPVRQICFYDPGLGAHPDGDEPGLVRRALNILSQATGYGITTNIVDCYTALLLSYEPGDQIFLFGFSRGAYTVRSLGGAIGLCGVPPGLPKLARWSELQRSLAHDVRTIAEEAVTRVYQERDETKRHEAAAAFRRRYGSEELPPTFVGVWDTVRALGVKGLNSFTLGRHSFNNNRLHKGVPHGRQALAIDENRKTFAPELWEEDEENPDRIKQVWFAGVHTDVGGGYGLKMGLSDITLDWMLKEATAIPQPLIVDPALPASLTPDALGQQHDQLRRGWIPFTPGTREGFVPPRPSQGGRPIFGTVPPRFEAPEVQILDERRPYRPQALRAHPDFSSLPW
ncbi:DUF2235 domain-containing protein [Bosea sp. (in: a-proteobacteria)]|jgi:uncharacterized protein (DUF2235 family)|uniref:DUF2235 domain-containing protein n=1 Tax=Bosea sp. (in: a-proteobacteria) TaxID=1871050 RepID=UPI003561E4EC